MTLAFVFLLSHSLKNRILARFRRLRRPKYLVSALAGLAYLYFLFLHQPLTHRPGMPGNDAPENPAALLLIEAGFAFMLMIPIVLQWFFSNSKAPLFNEAEIQFLFPAPISRTALLNYRIAKAQIGILFGTVVSFILFGRGRLFEHPLFILVTIWGVYSFLYLYRIAVLLEIQNLNRQGIKGRQRRAWILALVLVTVISVAAASRWFYPPIPSVGTAPDNLVAWLTKVVGYGPIFYVLYPFRLLIHPAFASSLSQFLLRLLPALLMIAAAYACIRRGEDSFEEAVVGQQVSGEDTSSSAGGRGRRAVLKPRRPPFRLDPDGSAVMGIYWKNLSLVGGLTLRRALPGLAVLAVVGIALAGASGPQAPVIAGSVCAGLAGFLTLMGPVLFRDDLRTDLRNIDLLKAYPIPGWGIILGEVLAPATMLTLLEWLLILLAAGMSPAFGEHSLSVPQRIYAGIAAALILPCLSLIGIIVQNAAVLLLPGWIHLGREHQRGVEAMGQRLISGLATMVSLLIAALPAALLFLLAWLAGYWIIGMAVIPVASLVAAIGLLGEAAIGIILLGRLFDKFDASKEMG